MDINEDIIIEIENIQGKIQVTDDIRRIIKACIDKVLDMEAFDLRAMVSVTLTDNPGIRQVNFDFRGIDSTTDVLSFPMLDLQPGDEVLEIDDFLDDADPDTGAVILGDILISLEKAREQAKEYGHSFDRELGFLVVHGMLHLLGYDHMTEQDRGIMRTREEAVLEALNLMRT